MAELLEYKCPCCGGAIAFDSQKQKMKCPYCDTEFDVETLKSYDEELNSAQAEDMEWKTQAKRQWSEEETAHIGTYICNSCGGEIIGDENTAATKCPFCDNPVVMVKHLSGELKPDYVIAFKLDKQAAKAALSAHLNKKRLLPKLFRSENHIDEIKGIYVPFWLFNADSKSDVKYNATRTRHWSDHNYNYTEISHFLVTRQGDLGFECIPVDGSSKIPDALMESIEPFYFNDAVDFQTAYLAGYFADKYDVDSQNSIERANNRIKKSVENAFANTVKGYSSVKIKSSNVNLLNSEEKYALYPVWLLNTTWNGKKYTFAMNGQTGKLAGDLPMDKGAFWRWFIGLALGSSAVLYAIYLLFFFLV